MKTSLKKYAYIVCFFSLAAVFAIIYYASYYYALNNMKSDNILTKDKIVENNPGMSFETETTDSAQVNSVVESTITQKTKYYEETYNIDTQELLQEEKSMPVELIGLNRDGVIDYLSTYKTKINDETLVNVQLVSFSESDIVIRKSIREVTKNYYYYVVSQEDIIVIYKADKTTKYFDTGINISNFDAIHKAELEKGFYIETIHDLYNYLESITS